MVVELNARHRESEGQDSPYKALDAETIGRIFHDLGPPVGSVDVSMCPPSSVATHSDSDGHDTA